MQRRLLFCIAGFCILSSCTMPMRNYLEQGTGKKVVTSDSLKIDTVVPQTATAQPAQIAALAPPPPSVPIDSLIGEEFIVLQKPALYCDYGYELYTCPLIDSCKGAPDPAIETRQHRVKCTEIVHHRIHLVAVDRRGNERLLTFNDSSLGRRLYAVTNRLAYSEVGRVVDLAGARARWLNTAVFAKRGFISVLDGGRVGTLKVRLQDTLTVIDVVWGRTPLPVKPIWLLVRTPKSERGFIPVRYSWTNTKDDLVKTENPWDEDVFEQNPALLFPADSVVWNLINSHNIRIGMTRNQVELSWGMPPEKVKRTYDSVEREVWRYPKQELIFDDAELIAINDK